MADNRSERPAWRLTIEHLFVDDGAVQRSFDDLGRPLHDTTFCVIDLETTGGAPQTDTITEIGAVKLRGGECLGRFQTLVDPGRAIPPRITVLTGITESMVLQAPRIETVLPSLLEFIDDAVIVGHNVRFDLGFLSAALSRSDREQLTNPSVDTCALARRLLHDEVPNHRLGTLAERLRLDHRPSHRALDDALATGDLLHVLIERATALGVTGLDDLLALPTMAGHPQAAKLTLTDDLPRGPGVYLFRDRSGRVLYVGKAANLRARVRSYFSTDQRRKVAQLLREVAAIEHLRCANGLEAAVREIRLIHEHLPRFNQQGTRASRYVYVKLTVERFPRLAIVRRILDDDAHYLGPLSSQRAARNVIDAIHTASTIRRCTSRPTATPRDAPCAPAQLGVALCPCAGATSEADYRLVVDAVRRGLGPRPDVLLGPLEGRMQRLASDERFEEAAAVRDRAQALVGALARQRRYDLLRRTGRLVLAVDDSSLVELDGGRLVGVHRRAEAAETTQPRLALEHTTETLKPPSGVEADELLCVASWLDRNSHKLTVMHADGPYANPAASLPDFTAREPQLSAR